MEEFDESKPIEGVASGDGDAKIAGTDDAAPSIEGSTSDPLARFAKKRRQEANAVESKDVVGSDALAPEAMVERELADFESLLRPIERFGVNHLESFQDDTLNLELEQFEVSFSVNSKVNSKGVIVVITLLCFHSFGSLLNIFSPLFSPNHSIYH